MPRRTLGEAVNQASRLLQKKGIASPRLDAEVLLAHVLNQDRVYLYREAGSRLGTGAAGQYSNLLERRATGEPVAYLTGHQEFMGLDFLVGPRVLIPRPETELMVEYALGLLKGWSGLPVAVDVGTGSGAVAVSLARLAPGCAVYATDVSLEALVVARENANRHGVQVYFGHGDLLGPLQGVLEPGAAAVIAANLPYIPKGDIPGLPRDVRGFEPHEALDGGSDGLELYRRLVPQALVLLAPGGHLLMEIGPDQAQEVLHLTAVNHLWDTRVLPDLAGRLRLAVARKK
ncbi:MAG TPA: peptide chain release factor N(5)-glutamine methyltransferase [Desulfotomaculum sp.]|nr:MAG: hypothetical protein VR67_11125 [Peptococcaceae bacterium BRH_c8a]KJS75915.1 MAG: hypothetical protein JL56_06685 [Desulfotomaculum sp. BICA1-6]HBX23433.1 peptide chain release factor N(5)-glutamine methyltransferase [Desulfotomaculum sp.]